MAQSIINCHRCGKEVKKENGHITRARKQGNPLFCDRVCFGLHHRANKTDDQKKEEKREYDKQYRLKHLELLRAKKAAHFKKTYNPQEARIKRKEKSAEHAEYCRQPKYKAWKKEYDQKHRAKKNYGEYWECFILTMNIRDECLKHASDYEIRQTNGTLNKSQQRKRNARINSN